MVALDANFLIRFILGSDEYEASSLDVNVSRALYSIETKRFLIPTPALSEVMVKMDHEQMASFIGYLHGSKNFLVQPFDQKAAIEAALAVKKAMGDGDKRAGSKEKWQKVKVDYQIAAIAKANRVSRIYTNDSDIDKVAAMFGLDVVTLDDIEPLPSERQISLALPTDGGSPGLH
ncbi:PIN domain-containing protein [Halomonas denitrificans]|uniref:type II toxin-antitoxin system VapC family toxin n=1 Tax=Halomonas denitrificans TaxID=370769 RepID=UPI001CD7682B|nr:PIN domain-containing protein [Halomonas denitrificans]MCA0973400.1 PIN domain-containing protein [Halomonas denitrificans]